MALRFRFRWIPFLATLIAAAVGIALGDWQTRRAQEKEAIEARLLARESQPVMALKGTMPSLEELEYRRVTLRGSFVPEWNVFLDNRPYAGAAGFEVLAPFRLARSDTFVLVKRGWVPRDVADRTRVPAVATRDQEQEIVGTVRRHVGKTMQLGTPEPLRAGAIVQNVELDEFARAGRWNMAPFVVEQLNDGGDHLVRDWTRPSSGADKHRGYAFQWYGLAAAALIFFFVTGLSRGSKHERSERK